MVMGACTGAGGPSPGIQVRHSAAVSGGLPVLSCASCTAWPHFTPLPRMMSEDVSTGPLTVNAYWPSGPKRTAGTWAANLQCRPLCRHPAAVNQTLVRKKLCGGSGLPQFRQNLASSLRWPHAEQKLPTLLLGLVTCRREPPRPGEATQRAIRCRWG